MPDIEISPAQEPPVENAKVSLVIERGEARNRIRDVNGPLFLIGSNEDADLVLGDSQFTEYHAYICVRGDEVTLRHLGNPPEVTVNGRIVRWGELRDGDRLRMGPYQFRIAITPVAEMTEPPTAGHGEQHPPSAATPTKPSTSDSHDTQKRWAAHHGSNPAKTPKSDAWRRATTPSQVVGWFDQMERTR